MVRKGVKYRWCPYHNQGKGMWVTHSKDECCNKPNDEGGSHDGEQNQALQAIAEINEDESDEDEDE